MTKTYKVKNGCKMCKSPTYYYPVKLLLESTEEIDIEEYIKNDPTYRRVVSITCSGETPWSTIHTMDYVFPIDFEKI